MQITNGEIRWRTIRAAQNLAKLGIGFDDVIQVIAKNHHYLAPIVFAAFTLGAPVNGIDVQFTKGSIDEKNIRVVEYYIYRIIYR